MCEKNMAVSCSISCLRSLGSYMEYIFWISFKHRSSKFVRIAVYSAILTEIKVKQINNHRHRKFLGCYFLTARVILVGEGKNDERDR